MNPEDRPAPQAGPCPPAGYGPHAKTRPPIQDLAQAIERILETRPRGEVADAVAEALAPLLEDPELLDPCHCEDQPETYRRHVLYADPERRFTILSLVWRPGHVTPIHGHRAWGAVGVRQGTPNVALYDCRCENGTAHVERLTSDTRIGPGDTTTVQPGYEDVHKVYNASEAPVVTIHVYGRDLVEDPASINLLVESA